MLALLSPDLSHRFRIPAMGKCIQPTTTAGAEQASFGERLTALRKAAGFTQVELAAELGAFQRMVAYYERPTADDLYRRDLAQATPAQVAFTDRGQLKRKMESHA